jgi:hypothetical protein
LHDEVISPSASRNVNRAEVLEQCRAAITSCQIE